MTSPSFNYFYRVEIQVAQYTLGGIKDDRLNVRELITRTYNFVNKSLRDATTPSDRETYIPILESIGEVTLSAGEVLPSFSLSSIALDDSRGSFGPDRRFSDLLERFTLIGQPLTIYLGESPNEIDAPSSWTKLGAGRITSWSKALSGDKPTMTIQIEPFKISERVMNIEVSRDIEGMENAPQASLGKALPIVFNKVNSGLSSPLDRYPQVLPTRISFDGSESAKYALTTQLYEVTKARIQPVYYAKKAWEDGSDIWAPISLTRTAPNYTTPLVGTYYSINTVSEKAHRIPQLTTIDGEKGFVVTGVELRVKGNSTSPTRVSTASMTVSLLLVDRDTYDVVKTLGTGTVQLNNYDALNNAGGTFSVNVSFDTPSVIELTSDRSYDFYISWKGANIATDDLVLQKYNETVPMLYRSQANTQDNWGRGTSEQMVAHRLRIATGTSNSHEDTYTRDGYTYSSMTLTQPTPDAGQYNCDLDSLEIVSLVEGFCGYVFNGGTTAGTSSAYTATLSPAWSSYIEGRFISVTPHVSSAAGATLNVNGLGAVPITVNGSPVGALALFNGIEYTLVYNGTSFEVTDSSTRFYDPPTVLKLLSYEWDGEQWSDVNAVDTTTLKASHYDELFASASGNHRARYLTGIIEAKSTYSQVISEIARGTASKIGVFSNGKLFVHPWGVNSDLSYVIPQADIIPLSWENRPEDSVVNRSQITFEKYYATNISQDAAKEGYKYSIDFSNESYLAVQQITEQSRSLFGAKNIVENTFNVFGFSDTNPVVGLPGYLTGGSTASQPSSGGVVIYSVDFLADYYISRFALPFIYCSFVVPYHRYKDIKMFDVISFHHSEFPAYFGTDPAARAGVVNDGTSVTTVPSANYGEELVRAQSYRGLVEAVSYVMAMEHAPAIRLTVQVLVNTEYDPT
jgi:hypothetical protein